MNRPWGEDGRLISVTMAASVATSSRSIMALCRDKILRASLQDPHNLDQNKGRGGWFYDLELFGIHSREKHFILRARSNLSLEDSPALCR